MGSGKIQSKTYSKSNDTVMYTDSFSDNKIEVMISEVHKDHTHVPYYTIRFKNGKEKRASIESLQKQPNEIIKIDKCDRLKHVDTSNLGTKPPANPYVHKNPYVTPNKNKNNATNYEPAQSDLNNFLKSSSLNSKVMTTLWLFTNNFMHKENPTIFT